MGVTSESDVLESGHVTTTVAIGQTAGGVDSEGAPLLMGMACCFDLRFLAQYGPRIDKPVHCICAPSAFLVRMHFPRLTSHEVRMTSDVDSMFTQTPTLCLRP